MARIRTVKPEFWSSPQAARCSRDARLCFIGLLNECDDEGRMRWAPKRLAGVLFPNDDDVDAAQVTGWVDELAAAVDGDGLGLVARYEAGGDQFLVVPAFLRHQRISKPQPSALPVPPFPVASRNGRGADADGARTSRGGNGREGKGKEGTGAPRRTREPDLIFEAICEVAAWPLDELTASNRGRANSAAKELRDLGVTPDEIRKRARNYRATYPDTTLTPQALVGNWAGLTDAPSSNGPRPQPKPISQCDACGELTVDCRC